MHQAIQQYIRRPVAIAPLVTFRILFGGLMMVGAIRFMSRGWIERLYVEPRFFFKFYGFEWVRVLDATGMYLLYGFIAVAAALIMLGLFYRAAIIGFFLAFTYAELIDATNYLNHYYLVCLLALLMIFLPAHRRFSLDVWRRPALRLSKVPAWTIGVLMLQIGIVYFFAGFAKLNPDWLFQAMPLAAWLPTKVDVPVVGYFFQFGWVAFAFSWAGAVYDLTIPFFLLNRHTRPFAYAAVIVFHSLTYLLFNIGLFPFIMIFNTLIFFPARFHEKLLGLIGYRAANELSVWAPVAVPRLPRVALTVFFLFQLAFPLRYLLYPGHILWTEEGYRFAWRVMLVEKAGQATFRVRDPETGRVGEVVNSDYLTPFQEKQMAVQADFILQFAHFIAEEYRERYGIRHPVVTVDSYVALNGRPSRRFIDPAVNLAALDDSFEHKKWILPFKSQ